LKVQELNSDQISTGDHFQIKVKLEEQNHIFLFFLWLLW